MLFLFGFIGIVYAMNYQYYCAQYSTWVVAIWIYAVIIKL